MGLSLGGGKTMNKQRRSIDGEERDGADMEQGRQKRAEVLRAFHAWSRAASNGFGFLPF